MYTGLCEYGFPITMQCETSNQKQSCRKFGTHLEGVFPSLVCTDTKMMVGELLVCLWMNPYYVLGCANFDANHLQTLQFYMYIFLIFCL